MSAAQRSERLGELKITLAIKSKELEKLEAHIAAESERLERGKGSGNGASPIQSWLERSLKDKAVLNDIPLQHIGNTTTLMKFESEEARTKIKNLDKEIHDLNERITSETNLQRQLQQQVERLKKQTGYTDNPKTTFHEDKEPSVDAKTVLEATKKLRAEVRVAETVSKKKTTLILDLQKQLDKRKAWEEELGEQINANRVLDRQLVEEKYELERVLRQHAELDDELKAISDATDHVTRAIVDCDKAKLVKRTAELVDRRREDDRVKKAQEFRLDLLTRRVATINTALERHNLKERVEERIHQSLKTQEENAAIAASAAKPAAQSGGNDDVPAAIEDGATPQRGGTVALITPDSVERYCQLENIVPDDEVVPGSVYSLFVADREKRQKSIRRQEIMLREKISTVDALQVKLGELTANEEASEDRRFIQLRAQDAEVVERLENARRLFDEHRAAYVQLKQESLKVSAELASHRHSNVEAGRPATAPPPSSAQQRPKVVPRSKAHVDVPKPVPAKKAPAKKAPPKKESTLKAKPAAKKETKKKEEKAESPRKETKKEEEPKQDEPSQEQKPVSSSDDKSADDKPAENNDCESKPSTSNGNEHEEKQKESDSTEKTDDPASTDKGDESAAKDNNDVPAKDDEQPPKSESEENKNDDTEAPPQNGEPKADGAEEQPKNTDGDTSPPTDENQQDAPKQEEPKPTEDKQDEATPKEESPKEDAPKDDAEPPKDEPPKEDAPKEE